MTAYVGKISLLLVGLFCVYVAALEGYSDCGSTGTILAVSVTDCDKPPCVVYKPDNYSIGITFIASCNSTRLDTKISAFVGGISVPWPAPSACGLMGEKTCPIVTGETYDFNMTMQVKPDYPDIDTIVKTALRGDEGVVQACVEFPLVVR